MNLVQFGQKFRTEIVILLCVLFVGIIAMNTMCACKNEGFVSTPLGAELTYSMGEGVKTSWEKPSKTKDFGYKMMDATNSGPLPASEMLIFDNTKFSPDCCPSIYSNSFGCVCATSEQMKFLNQRGGNRTLNSEY